MNYIGIYKISKERAQTTLSLPDAFLPTIAAEQPLELCDHFIANISADGESLALIPADIIDELEDSKNDDALSWLCGDSGHCVNNPRRDIGNIIRLPSDFRRAAKNTKQLVVVGRGRVIQIFTKAKWDECQKDGIKTANVTPAQYLQYTAPGRVDVLPAPYALPD